MLHGTPHSSTIIAATDCDEPLVTACLRRDDFEKLHGPLQFMLDHEVHRREQIARQREKQLHDLDLVNATRASFHFTNVVSTLQCGELYLARHSASKARYTVRQEVKARLKQSKRSKVDFYLRVCEKYGEARTNMKQTNTNTK